ncbi:MAG: putative lipid II flippase FtsW [Clostridiales bacterium]|nr:putative lipid II flippase FtsW [Clostridiales bacterium]
MVRTVHPKGVSQKKKSTAKGRRQSERPSGTAGRGSSVRAKEYASVTPANGAAAGNSSVRYERVSGAKTPVKNSAGGRAVRKTRKRVSSRSAAAKKTSVKKQGFIRDLFVFDGAKGEIDTTFLLLVGVLTVFGLIMLLSASAPTADVKFSKSYYFFIRQFGFAAVGAGLMLMISKMNYKKLKKFAVPLMLFCIVLLTMVFLPGIGVSHNGSRRWINLVAFEFQPSELTKLAISMFFAALIEDKRYDITKVKGLFQFGAWMIVIAALMMLETHVSGTVVLCAIALCIMIAAGANIKIIFGGGAALGACGLLFLRLNPVRWARVINFMNDPLTGDRQSTGYQVIQSLYAIGSGGIFGKGLGQSVQKFSYLPEPYNDFIFAIVCEELGLIGAAFIICLFAGLIMRGIRIALEAPDTFGTIVVVGIMAQVAVQTLLNIAVVTSTIPNTGVPLPFFSYGGTAIMILLMEMGVVLSVSRQSAKNAVGKE